MLPLLQLWTEKGPNGVGEFGEGEVGLVVVGEEEGGERGSDWELVGELGLVLNQDEVGNAWQQRL